MADFMTVLAASQKQTPGGAQGKALAALLPGELFENVLTARIEAVVEGEDLALPLLLSDELVLPGQAAVKKPVLMAADSEKAVIPDGLIPMFASGSLDIGKSAAEVSSDAGIRATPLEWAASPAAFATGKGQDLPLSGMAPSVPPKATLDAQFAARPEAVGLLLTQAPVNAPAELSLPLDQSATAAARQLGQFEQLTRVPEAQVRVAIETPVRGQGFPAEFAEKIVWLAGRQSQLADLSLNPPQLGSLEVRLSLSGSDAGAQFYSPHQAVRDAIEAALPKLRELMAQAGIALGDAQVRDQAFARREAGGNDRAGAEVLSDEPVASLAVSGGSAVRAGLGLVDLYV